MIDLQHPVVAADGSGVVQILSHAVHEAHDRDVAADSRDLLEREQVLLDEVLLEHEVFRGIAGEAQLGKQ